MEFYPFIRGALSALAMVTVAVAGLTFLQHGSLLYVIAGFATGILLYLVVEWAMPVAGSSKGNDLENTDDPDHNDHKEGEGR